MGGCRARVRGPCVVNLRPCPTSMRFPIASCRSPRPPPTIITNFSVEFSILHEQTEIWESQTPTKPGVMACKETQSIKQRQRGLMQQPPLCLQMWEHMWEQMWEQRKAAFQGHTACSKDRQHSTEHTACTTHLASVRAPAGHHLQDTSVWP